jgi:hypothetical protein
MRCDTCGARNAEGATWCTQCYASFTPDRPEPPIGASDASPTSAAGATGTGPSTDVPLSGTGMDAPSTIAPADGVPRVASPVETGAAEGTDAADPAGGSSSVVEVGDVRELDGVVEWRCRACESWVALEMPSCHACGSPRAGFGEDPRPQASVAASNHGKVLTAAALFPGVGHLVAGRTGSGATRLALGLLWLMGGIWWVATTAASGSAPGVVLILGALVLWVASYLDVQAILSGRDEPFGVRGLLWSVVGVTALLMVAVAWLATGPSLS